jgi:hypothetical protein
MPNFSNESMRRLEKSIRTKRSEREALIEDAYDCMVAEMTALPDDQARAAVFLRLARDMSEWTDEEGIAAMTSPERSGDTKGPGHVR